MSTATVAGRQTHIDCNDLLLPFIRYNDIMKLELYGIHALSPIDAPHVKTKPISQYFT